MKKILLLLISVSMLLVGCGKGSDEVLKKLNAKLDIGSYYMEGKLEIVNNDDTYQYDVNVSYKKDDNFKVSLNNTINNHQQIILKNADGVYVLTPSLNKSFKFQSDWPYNNSQIYLIQNIIDDINNDKDRTMETVDKIYVITSKVNYTNNPNLKKQKVYIDKNMDIKKVEVIDAENTVLMKMEFNKIEMNHNFDDSYFKLETSLNVDAETNFKESIDKVIFPLYIPSNTFLESQNGLDTETGERAILTFKGDKPFMLFEETVSPEDKMISMYGDPIMVGDTYGAINDTSLTWYSNGLEYYIVADKLSQSEIVSIANSIGSVAVSK